MANVMKQMFKKYQHALDNILIIMLKLKLLIIRCKVIAYLECITGLIVGYSMYNAMERQEGHYG